MRFAASASPQEEAGLCSSCPQLCRDGKFPVQPTVPCAVHMLLNRYILSRKDSVICCHWHIFSTHMCCQKWALRILHFRRLFQLLTHIHEAPFHGFGRSCSLVVLQDSSTCVNADQIPTQTITVFKSLNNTQEASVSSEIFTFHYVHYTYPPPSFPSWGLAAQKWAKLESIWPELYSCKQCQIQSRGVTLRMRYKALLPRYIFNRMTSLPDLSVHAMLTDHIFHWYRPMEAAICQQVPGLCRSGMDFYNIVSFLAIRWEQAKSLELCGPQSPHQALSLVSHSIGV